KYYHNTYEIVTRSLENALFKGGRKEYLYFKNRPLNVLFNTDSVVEKTTGYEVLHQELEYPSKLLVNSIMNNDRFVFKSTQQNKFYQYLGARSTSSTASTKSSVRRTITHIFNAKSSNDVFINNLKDLLSFLDFEKSFKVV